MKVLSKHRGFFDFFPPPKFLSMLPAGVAVSDDSVKCIELVATPSGMRIGRFGEEIIPSGAISNGVIQNAALVEKALSSLQTKHNLSFVRASFPEKEAYLLERSLPLAPRESLRETIESQFEEYVPMRRAESVFDFDVAGVSEKQGIARVQVSAASQAFARTYESVFRNAGMLPLAFEAEEQALARAIVQEGAPGTALVVDIGKRETTFAIVHEGSVWFTSSFEFGGESITQALGEALSLPLAKAEQVKCLYGVVPPSSHKEVAEEILKQLKPIEEKIRQHLSYQETLQNKKMPVERVIMSGGGSNLPGFAEYLEQSLGIPVTLANPWVNIISFDEYVPTIPLEEALRYASAIGLAMMSANN
ncbi:MAG: pilus assembly protein PilM [Candidatus Lloydbacteria bacterium]|nr:pilus assembly protein PilM [Candidatus Lloydbacteria bacterium]